jgi:hypothetical protein
MIAILMPLFIAVTGGVASFVMRRLQASDSQIRWMWFACILSGVASVIGSGALLLSCETVYPGTTKRDMCEVIKSTAWWIVLAGGTPLAALGAVLAAYVQRLFPLFVALAFSLAVSATAVVVAYSLPPP